MFRFEDSLRVYLHREPVDFRLSVNGLSALVQNALGLDPFAPAMYGFCNRRADRIKLLLWDRNGFWLFYKRLEQDRFIWPRDEPVATLTTEQLHWLLQGINIAAMRRHPDRHYERVG